MDLFDEVDIVYQKEINIGFFGIPKEYFEKIIKDLQNSSFSKEFSLIDKYFDMEKDKKASFQKMDNNENLGQIYDENDKDNDLIINIHNCEENYNKKDKKNYEEFIKEKIDYFLIVEEGIKDKTFLDKIYKYSKGNFIIFTLGYNKENEKLFESKDYNDFVLVKDNVKNINNYKFDIFLLDLKKKFDMFVMFQKYSTEKNIVTFKDYIYYMNKYNNIKDEKEFIELFNKFETLSFNDDYADNTLIMLQIMASNKEMFNDNICFNVKSIKCGFCTERLNISEFDTQLQSFLCYRCRYQQAFYPNN